MKTGGKTRTEPAVPLPRTAKRGGLARAGDFTQYPAHQKIFSKKGCCLEEEQYLEIPKDRDLRRMFYKIRLAGLALSADMLVFASAVQGAEAVGYLHDLEIKVPEEIEVMAVGKEETALICRPQLTTVEFDKKRFVRQAIEELYVQMIKGYILTKS